MSTSRVSSGVRPLRIIALAVALVATLLTVGPPPAGAAEVPVERFEGGGAIPQKLGDDIDVDGLTAVVGAPGSFSAGEVYIYKRATETSTWTLDQTITSTSGTDGYGTAVAVDGNALVVGGLNEIEFFTRPDATSPFTFEAAISTQNIASVDLEDEVAIVAFSTGPGNAEAKVYQRTNPATSTLWDEMTTLVLPTTPAQTLSVAVTPGLGPIGNESDDIFVYIGAPEAAGGAGEVYTAKKSNGTWGGAIDATVTSPDAGDGVDEWFGAALDADENNLFIGEQRDDTSTIDQGAVWAYSGTHGSFGAPTLVQLAGITAGDNFGNDVDWDPASGLLIVGASGADPDGPLPRQGAAYVFDSASGFSLSETLYAYDGALDDGFGTAVAISSETIGTVEQGVYVLVGAPAVDVGGTVNGGAFYPFYVDEPAAPAFKIISGDNPLGRNFGQSVGAFPGGVAVGNPEASGADGKVEVLVRPADAINDYALDQVLTATLIGQGFGRHVAADGNRIAVAYRDANQIDVWDRTGVGSPWAFDQSISTAEPISAIDLDGDVLVAGSANVATAELFTFPGGGGAPTTLLVNPAGTGPIDDVAVSETTLAVSVIDPVGTGGTDPGIVTTFTYNTGTTGWDPGAILNNPDAALPTAGVFFGDSLDVDGDTLVIGVHDSESAPFSGAAWIYEETAPGVFGTPVKIKSATPLTSDVFAGIVHIDDNIIVSGSPGQGNGGGLNGRTGGAALIKRDPDTGIWSLDSEFQAPDRTLFDQRYGIDVVVLGEDVIVGASWDDNENGEQAGAVYTYKTPVPIGVVDNPDITVTVFPGSPTATAGATGISVVDLPPTAIEGYGGTGSGNIVGTSLNSVDGAATDADPSEILEETTVADLGLDGTLLDSILLSDVVIDGGWDTVLVGTAFEGIPLQNITLGDVVTAGILNGRSLDTIDLSATPIGAIPIGAIAVGSTPIGAIALPGGQDWCTLLGDVSPGYNCSTIPAADPVNDTLIDLAIQGTPIGAIPIGAIPIGAIPIGAIPIGAIPIGAIDIEGAPIGAIPIGAIRIGATPIGAIPIGAIPIGAIPIGAIDVGGTPIGAIDVAGAPIGAIPLGQLDQNGGVAASPIGAIPIGAIELAGTPIGAIPIGAIPIGAIPIGAIPIGAIPIGAIDVAGAPIGAIPIGAIDIAGSPIGAIPIGAIGTASTPIGAIPIGAIPIGAIPIGAIPIGAIPIGAIDVAGAPIGAIPIGAIDLAASPIGAIPIGAIPIGAIGSMVDCSLIDCDPAAGFTLADAQEAGALQSTATVAGLDGITDSGVTFDDLVGLDGIDEATLRAAIDAQTSVGTLADFQTYDAMVLAELPASQTASTTLEQLGDALATVSLADFLAATDDIDETGLRAELTTEGVNNLADLPNYDGIELGDLPASDAQFQAQTLDALLPAMENIRLGDILDYHATLTGNDVDWGTATLADLSAWEDVTLEELATYNGTTLADLITDLVGNGTEGDLTFGDVLLSLVGTEAHDWADVDLGALELESTGSPITITSSFEIDGNSSIARTLQITTTIPLDAQYVPGSAALTEISTTLTPSGFGEPTINGNELTWTLSGAGVGGEYQVSIDIIPSLSLGTSTVSTTGRLAASGVESTAIGSVGIAQAFEPNDNIGDSGVLTAVSDTIYASHIATEDDVDLFRVDLAAGSRLAASLSDLPADFDLVVYGPPAVPVSDQPALRQINPTEPPEVTLEAAANQSGGAVLQDVPLQDLPVIAVSNNRDNAGESIDIQSVRSTGTYYIQVSGYSGATSADPYALFVKTVDPPAPLVCAAQSYQSAANTGSLPSAAALAGVNTLILVNQERLFGKYGTDANTALTALNDLVTYTNTTNPGLGITAAIVPVDGDANVRAAYNDLDSAACEPDKANAVVREINRVIDDMRDLDPNTEITQIMIAGDDDIIPMARLADDTTIANESGYAQTFLGTEANSYFGALVNSMYLSDEPYGDVDPIQSGERILYVTDVALGRLVERPDEIAGQVVAFIASGGQLDPSTSYVSGYDFLDDGAQAVADELAALPDTTSVVTEISETWTAADVIADLFPATGPSPQVASINAHYDHYRALPADQNAAGTENDLFTTADVDDPTRANLLTGRILSSMGCHGGLHVPDELFGSTTDPRALDWAQVYARQAATWVGNTGYGYGETEGVELSERLMALYAANLDGSVTVGEALFYAKQTYLGTQQAEYGPFDEKVLQEATFYGIPFYQISVATPPAPAPLPPQPTTVPVAGTSLDLTTIQSDPTLVATATAGQGTSYEAVLPAGDPGVPDQQSTPFAPIEPTVSYDVSFVGPDGEPERIAQGAIITGLTTDDVGGIDPDIALPIVDDSSVETEPDVGDINTDPAVFVSSFETPEGPRQSVTSLLGTFTSDQPDGSGTQRLFEELTLDVYYRDPAASADQTRPIFDDVEGTIASGVLTIEATVNDDQPDNVIRVLALVVQDAASDTVWTPVELVDLGSGRWSGSLVVTGTEIEYLVQAVDGSGNTALTTNKSRLFVEDPTPPPPDPTITVTASAAPANDPYYNAPVTLTATADGQPIDYRIDGGAIVTAGTTANVLLDPGVLGDGAVTVEFTSGNAQRTETILFDTTSPVVEITSPVDGATYDSATPIPVAFSCADAASGIASCDALLNGAPVTPGDVTLAAGSYTLTLNGSDTVGNSASPVSVTFTVEDGAPPADPLMIEMLNVDGVAAIGEEVEVLIDFTGSGSPHSVTIDWGDGTSCTAPGSDPNCVLTEPTVDDPGTVEAWHTYNANGVVDVTITLTSSNNETITEVVTLKSCTITGTNGNDTLFGTQGDDVICGRGGNDRIVGRGGNDVLVGGKGNDRLEGGRGDDILLGNRGNDRLWGGAGEDVLRGGRDNDRLDGQGNADKLSGGSGADRLNGGGGNDELRGGKGRDVLIGSSGDDLMIGGRDADQLNGGGGKDTMYGRGGPDLLIGGNADDELRGGGGDDDLRGGGGADELIGGSGNDRCRGNGGNNTLVSCER